ncbi:MAG: hypothetical protein LBG27_01895 [Spirochaetaceae bacterium]|nr:hypothetical protein [Spirochaetaceae bacterium]
MAKARQENTVESLKLQQRSLDIAAERQKLDTARLWVNAGFKALNSGLTFARAVSDTHDQQNIKDVQEFQEKYKHVVDDAIMNGNNGTITLPDGQKKWVGFEDVKVEGVEGVTTLGELKEQYLAKAKETYWTPAGEKKGMAMIEKAITDTNSRIRAQVEGVEVAKRDALFEENYKNAYETAVKNNDFSLLRDVIDSTSAWKSEEERQTLLERAADQFKRGVAEEQAFTIMREEGFVKADEFIQQSDLLAKDKEALRDSIQGVGDRAISAEKTAASQIYDKVAQNGGTFRDAYESAISTESQNPEVIAARKEIALEKLAESNQNQFISELIHAKTPADYEALAKKYEPGGAYTPNYIDQEARQEANHQMVKQQISAATEERFYNEVNSATLEQLKALLPKYKEGGEYEADYAGRGELQKQHYDYIVNRISEMEKKPQEAKGPPYEATLEMAYKFRDRFFEGANDPATGKPFTGPDALAEILKLDLKAEDRNKITQQLFAGNDGEFTLAAEAFAAWDAYALAEEAKLTLNSPERIELKKRHDDTRKMLAQMRFSGQVKPEAMLAFVEKIKNNEIAAMLDKGLTTRNIAEARRQSILGGFDHLQYLQYDEYGNRHPVWINGAKQLFNDLNIRDTQTVEDLLKVSDWKIDAPKNTDENILGKFVEREPGDRTGEVIFNLRNGKGETATVRVGPNGTLEERVEEDGGIRWISFDGKLSEGRTARMTRYEAKLPADIRNEIEQTVQMLLEKSKAANTSLQAEQFVDHLRFNITRALGNRVSTETGKAYIESKIDEFRQKMNPAPAPVPAAPSMRGVGSQRNTLRGRGL